MSIFTGVPADRIEALQNLKPTLKLEKSGNSYVLTTVDSSTKELKFKEGVEFEENLTEDVVVSNPIQK